MFGGIVGGDVVDNSAAKPMAFPAFPCAQGVAAGSLAPGGGDGQGVAGGRAVVQWPPPEPASGSPEPLSDADTEPDWGMPPTHDALGDPTPSGGDTTGAGDGQRQGPRPGSGWELSEADGLGGEAGASQEWTLDCGGGLDLNLNTIASDTPRNSPDDHQDEAPPFDHPARAVDAGTGATTGADGPSPKKRAVNMVAAPPNEPAEDPPKGPLATPLSRQRTLPTSRDGRPRPSGPWIAGMMYWIARNTALQAQTGVSVVPARINSNSQVSTPALLGPIDPIAIDGWCSSSHSVLVHRRRSQRCSECSSSGTSTTGQRWRACCARRCSLRAWSSSCPAGARSNPPETPLSLSPTWTSYLIRLASFSQRPKGFSSPRSDSCCLAAGMRSASTSQARKRSAGRTRPGEETAPATLASSTWSARLLTFRLWRRRWSTRGRG